MDNIHLTLNENGDGEFYFLENNIKSGYMAVRISNVLLTVFHTEVAPHLREKNIGKKLLHEMIEYAKKHNNLKVLPICPYVHAQFKKHRDEYDDIWKKERVK